MPSSHIIRKYIFMYRRSGTLTLGVAADPTVAGSDVTVITTPLKSTAPSPAVISIGQAGSGNARDLVVTGNTQVSGKCRPGLLILPVEASNPTVHNCDNR